MYTIIPLAIVIVSLTLLIKLYLVFSVKIRFYATGFDSGFRLPEIQLLWALGKTVQMDDPLGLYWSIPSLDKSIAAVILKAEAEHNFDSPKTQMFLTHLYNYRTKLEVELKNRGGLESTKALNKGQRLKVIVKGYGIFNSKVLNAGRELLISLPVAVEKSFSTPKDWINQSIHVYFQRVGDASYSFETVVRSQIHKNQSVALLLSHSDTLFRKQQRTYVRMPCTYNAQLFIHEDNNFNIDLEENESGFRCIVEDISENGALIRIGGMGKPNIRIKIQFTLHGKIVIMSGVVRSVEYNRVLKQSRLHFEARRLNSGTKNLILSYVYDVLPKNIAAQPNATVSADTSDLLDDDATVIPEAEYILDKEDDSDVEQEHTLEQLEKEFISASSGE